MALACLVGLAPWPAAAASGSTEVYFVAIGSARYAETSVEGQRAFGDILGAGKSARLVADIFSGGGANFGIVLTSAPGKFVSRTDIDQALDSVLTRIVRDKPKHPLLVFYFAGHGVSEGAGWNLFAAPGDVVTIGDPARLAMEDFGKVTVHAADLVDRLQKTETQFLVFFDTCYEGTAARFDSPVLSEQTTEALSTISLALQKLNQFEGPNPVLFSSVAGQVVPTVPDPRDPSGDRLAPLARRLALLRQAHPQALSLAQLINGLRSPDLDPVTRAPVTFALQDSTWRAGLLGAAPATIAGELERRTGTATSAIVCCGPPAAAPQQKLAGVVELIGAAGDFISDGASWRVTTGANAIEPASSDTLRLEVANDEGLWTLQLASPVGQVLQAKAYPKAQRWPFQEGARPGLAIDGPGRSCNAVKGDFRILSFTRVDGAIRDLAFEARQICDDGPGVLTVKARLQALP